MGFSYGYDDRYGYGGYGGFDDLFGDPDIMAALSMVLGIFLVFFVVISAIVLVLYILRSIGLYRLAINRGMNGAALAWIPFIGLYRVGSIADDIAARGGAKSYYRHFLLAGYIISAVSSSAQNAMIYPLLERFFDSPGGFGHFYFFGDSDRYTIYSGMSTILVMISIATFVVTIIALNKIYKCYRPASSTLWTVLSVIFPFIQSIFPFVIRNSVPAPEWGPQMYYPVNGQNWQAPPQYPPYGQPLPPNGGYYPPPYVQPQQQYAPPPAGTPYQPPVAPNPPEPWELDNNAPQTPPRDPWDKP